MLDVTFVIVNYKTHHLVRAAVESIRRYYPHQHLLVIDNASNDMSFKWILSEHTKNATPILFNDSNIGHGPALHMGMLTAGTPWVVAFDSDCEIIKPGLLEMMEAYSDGAYAIGWKRIVHRISGVPQEWHLVSDVVNQGDFVSYIHPCCALYRVELYRQISPFVHHGAPCLYNMIDADKAGYKLVEVPVFDYVKHWVGGTRRMFDSERGDWNPEPDLKPKEWKPDVYVPI